MGLETGTFVGDLITSNPSGSDTKAQGDDHLRLVKSVLKNTFPNATRAFRFEAVSTKTAAYTVVAADQRSLILADASGGAFTVTLPLGSNVFAGFSLTIEKSDSSGNAVTVDGNGSETIDGAATRVLSVQYEAVKFMWDGSEWKALSVTKFGTSELKDGSITTAKIADGAITAAKVASGAVTSAKIASDAVTTAKVASGAISTAKVADDAVTYAKMQNISAAARVLGRASGAGAGDPTELTAAQLTAIANIFTSSLKGLVPASGGGTDNFLRADGTFAIPPGTSSGPTLATAQATTSGSSKIFGSLPSGLNQIDVMLDQVSVDNAETSDGVAVRLGDSGGVETTGYLSQTQNASAFGQATEYFVLFAGTGGTTGGLGYTIGALFSGILSLRRLTGNVWVAHGAIGDQSSDDYIATITGRKELSGELTQLEVFAFGAAFDNGQVSIQYQ